MTHIKNIDEITHLKIEENLSLETKRKKQRGRPKENIPDINAVSPKVLDDLKSTEFFIRWNAISKVNDVCGSYRKTEKWLRTYCPSVSISRKEIAKLLKSHELFKQNVRQKVKEFLENVKKNTGSPPTCDDLCSAFKITIEEYTRQKIVQISPKYPLGTKSTDVKRLNYREWRLRRKAKELN